MTTKWIDLLGEGPANPALFAARLEKAVRDDAKRRRQRRGNTCACTKRRRAHEAERSGAIATQGGCTAGAGTRLEHCRGATGMVRTS